ncbi:hypothetical protein ACWCPM_20330 [Streptomyces sp. NPDC002309]
MSGLPDTGRHEPDQVARRTLLTRANSIARQRQAPPGKDAIPLLKRVSQVRILPGAPAKRLGYPNRLQPIVECAVHLDGWNANWSPPLEQLKEEVLVAARVLIEGGGPESAL